MSQNPPPQYPPGLPPYAAVAPGARPGSVTALSILAIVFGSIGLLCCGTNLLFQVATIASGGKNPFAPNAPVLEAPGINTFNAIGSFISLAIAGFMLAGGMGGLKLRPSARRLMIRLSVVIIAWASVLLVVQIVWTIPASAEAIRRMQAQIDPQTAGMMSSMMGPVQYVTAIVSWVLWCVLPVCFLVLWRTPAVIAAFESTAPTGPGGHPPAPFPQ